MRSLTLSQALFTAHLLLVAGCGSKSPENVVLIVVDTLRADHLGLYGYDRPTSPRLTARAASGLVFDHAYASSSWTLPTFGSILTGLSPSRHEAGLRTKHGSKRWRRAPLAPGVATLPEILGAKGLKTAAIVNNPFLRPHFGADRGFEHYDYEQGRTADKAVDRAQAWISENRGARFFLMLHLIDPHLPYRPPDSTHGLFAETGSPEFIPRGRKKILSRLDDLTESEKGWIAARYDEEVAFVDQEVERLLRFLEEAQLWDRTLVLLTSDHGEELFDHGGFEHGHSMFQEILQVPLIVWGPGVRVGRESAPVSLMDLTPTILAATECKVGEDLEGTSLWQTMQTRSQSQPARRDIVAQNTLWGREKQALISWPYKLILNVKTGRSQLFDLAADPMESDDLAAKRSELARELERRLRVLAVDRELDDEDGEVTLSEEMEEELRALGYLD